MEGALSAADPVPAGFAPFSNPDTGVAAFRIGCDHIDVAFKSGGIYRYPVLSAGRLNALAG